MIIFDFIKAANFFPTYCPDIKTWKHKVRGKNSKGAPLTFTPTELQQISQGIKTMHEDYEKHIQNLNV